MSAQWTEHSRTLNAFTAQSVQSSPDNWTSAMPNRSASFSLKVAVDLRRVTPGEYRTCEPQFADRLPPSDRPRGHSSADSEYTAKARE